jgi:phage tail sheath protein FI
MAFSISPGVTVSEVDLTTVVPSVLTTAGAFAGAFNWGPANTRVQITSESNLLANFTQPDSNTAVSYFTAASFLAYGNNLRVVRALGASSFNADSNTTTTNIQVANKDQFEYTLLNNTVNANTYGPFMARYAGALGNSLTISVVDAASYSTTWNVNNVGVSSYFGVAPSTSADVTAAGGSNDQIHVVVVDSGGLFTGSKNTILEVFPFLSKASDAVDSLGNSNYYKNYIFNNSKYIYAVDPVSYSTTSATWGLPSTTTFATVATPQTITLAGGTDDMPSEARTQNAWAYFANSDEVDVSLLIAGNASVATQQYIIDNIANVRKDCVAFISPPSANVINQNGSETTNITAWTTALGRSSSYVVADSGWKYMFDKYNNTYRWIPLNGDIAGTCVYTDSVRDPWFSPAGYNRGNLKNVVKLAWNPTKAQRDTIYALGVNPVGTFPGQGTVLFGDKTLQSQPSAFDRINVRRLFIVLEKTIAVASKYSLFEFNDEFTRNQFVALVTPFLRDIQGRRGITDFRVVCDSTNNNSQVIDSNQFVGDIYIKPARSINYIQLNFVAVRTGVSFSEVVGKF